MSDFEMPNIGTSGVQVTETVSEKVSTMTTLTRLTLSNEYYGKTCFAFRYEHQGTIPAQVLEAIKNRLKERRLSTKVVGFRSDCPEMVVAGPYGYSYVTGEEGTAFSIFFTIGSWMVFTTHEENFWFAGSYMTDKGLLNSFDLVEMEEVEVEMVTLEAVDPYYYG